MSATNENLQFAFAGESQANRKYLSFAEKTEEEGYKQIAILSTVRYCAWHGCACRLSKSYYSLKVWTLMEGDINTLLQLSKAIRQKM